MSDFSTFAPGAADLETRAALLADRLTDGLKPLARVAYNYAWSWLPDGAAVFRDILNVLRRRHANAHVVIRPARVQGDEAAGDRAAARALMHQLFVEGSNDGLSSPVAQAVVATAGGAQSDGERRERCERTQRELKGFLH